MRTTGPPSKGTFHPGAPRLTWATAEMMSSPPAPPITSFDPWAALTKMEGTMDEGGRSPGTGGRTGISAASLLSQRPPGPPPPSLSLCWACPAFRPSCLPSSRPGALCSPGGGVTPEPRRCLQHRSRSSLLRRMPVRGEYTPWLQSCGQRQSWAQAVGSRHTWAAPRRSRSSPF